MQLTLIEHPAQEIISLKQAKDYLRVEHDFDDALISSLIRSTRELMETMIEKSILKQTWKCVISRGSMCGFNLNNFDETDRLQCMVTFALPRPPIMKILSVHVGGKKLEEHQYRLENVSGKFYLCMDLAQISGAKIDDSLEVLYESGMTEDPEKVPYQLSLANLMLIANAYQERYSQSHNELISQGIRQLINPFRNLRLI